MVDDKPISEARYHLLSRLAVAAARGDDPRRLLEVAVSGAVAAANLAAGAVRVFGPEQADLAIAEAGEDAARRRMREIDQSLLSQLRRNWGVRSLYMTLDVDGPAGLFSYPLRSRDTVIGAISGIAHGERNLAVEEDFVSSVAALIVLIGRTGPSWASEAPEAEAQSGPDHDARVKTQAVLEIGAALNHEINNPLMAVLGNAELLLRKTPPLDADAAAKLARIHEAAERIRRVTQGLMRITDAHTVPYPGGGSMIDIDGSPKRDESS